MGITRDSLHKRRLTGGKRKIHRKKRKYDLGRQPAATKIGPKRIHLVRCRGGNIKHRALRLETGNFSWATECTQKINICDSKSVASPANIRENNRNPVFVDFMNFREFAAYSGDEKNTYFGCVV
jgi:ribosomal protein eS8